MNKLQDVPEPEENYRGYRFIYLGLLMEKDYYIDDRLRPILSRLRDGLIATLWKPLQRQFIRLERKLATLESKSVPFANWVSNLVSEKYKNKDLNEWFDDEQK